MAVESADANGNNGSRVKIGAVAKHFNISVDLLRLYEREGLVIPLKSPKGTRYYTELDYPWIETVMRLVREARLNFAGIRHLLALLPCWDINRCEHNKTNCSLIEDPTAPCWINHEHCKSATEDCYHCKVYRSAPSCENLKALLVGSFKQRKVALTTSPASHV
jgi:DNA-binding transcriptional MerR regulator